MASPWLTLAMVVLAVLTRSDERGGVRVSAPMAVSYTGDVKECRPSPDGAWLVYSGFEGELFARSLDLASAPVRLGAPTQRVSGFAVAPDSARVVYWTEDGRLFSVAIDGTSAPVDLRARIPGAAGTALSPVDGGIEITPDAHTVVCLMRMQSGVHELFRVPITGDASATRLNHALPAGHQVGTFVFTGTWRLFLAGFQITRDGARVLYLAGAPGGQELWVAGLEGAPAPRRLSLAANGAVGYAGALHTRGYQVSPDSARVVYLAQGASELWSAPLDGSQGALLLERARRVEHDLEISPDSRRVVYRARVLVDGREQVGLHSAALAGRAPLDVLHGWRTDEEVREGFELSQGRVLFQLGREILLAPLDARTPPVPILKLPATFDARPRFAAGGNVVCNAGELLAVPLRRGARPIRLAPRAGQVLEYRLTPDRRRVVYRDDSESASTIELYSVSVDGAEPPVKLNPALVPGGNVQSVSPTDAWPDFTLSADSSFVVYLADQDVRAETLAYRVPTDGDRPAVLVTPRFGRPAVLGDVAAEFTFAHGGQVLYLADQDVDALQQLWSVSAPRSAAPGPALRLSRPFEYVTDYRLGAQGARAVYRYLRGDPDAWDNRMLASVAVDGSAPAVELSGPLGARQTVLSYALSPDGSRVVYLADQRQDELFDLWSVPSDGSAASTRLSLAPSTGAAPAGDFVYFGTDFAFTSASSQLIFRASTTHLDGLAELWNVPLDGLSRPSRIDATGADPGMVRAFVLTPDTLRAVFWEERDGGPGARLRSVPVEGGAVETLFTQDSAFGLSVPVVSPDSASAVFLQAWPNALYRVTLDGSGAPLLLHDALVHGGEPERTGLTIGANRRVVYRLTTGALCTVPLDGSSPPAHLEPSGRPVSSFLVSRDGSMVVFRAASASGELELWSARIDRSTAPVRVPSPGVQEFGLVGPFERLLWTDREGRLRDARLDGGAPQRLGSAADAGITAFVPAPDGSRVLFRSDRDQPDVFELFLLALGPPDAPRAE